MWRRGGNASFALARANGAVAMPVTSFNNTPYTFTSTTTTPFTQWRSYAKETAEEESKRKEETRKERVAKGLLELTLSAPHQTPVKEQSVRMVTIPAATGRMGVLAKHVPTIAPLAPGLVSIRSGKEGEKDQHYFISAGFATITPDSVCNITAAEVVPVEQLSPEAAKEGLETFTKKISEASSKEVKAAAEIAVQTYRAMLFAIEHAAKA
eukprot:TRINITY_DN506_c0_g1_i1.p1 TRINITY_DN506_c0_g1~~TRINITY_DN506_c0_g1_i1.p1  ORF type:complete len:210 (-),score=51.36 TRINITY_DN506_c0_g1_i1:100-729(-)